MRISDWSSDVCSSDLLTLGFTYNPASQIAQATRSNTAYSWTDAANGTDSYTANGLNQYTAAAGASLGYDARGNLTSIGADGYTYRSEEHTSELQSLMRSSYAVFCLKKKRTQQIYETANLHYSHK